MLIFKLSLILLKSGHIFIMEQSGSALLAIAMLRTPSLQADWMVGCHLKRVKN